MATKKEVYEFIRGSLENVPDVDYDWITRKVIGKTGLEYAEAALIVSRIDALINIESAYETVFGDLLEVKSDVEPTKLTWRIWQKQEVRRMKARLQDMAYVNLNNLFLSIERGDIPLTISTSNQLRVLVGVAYDTDDVMVDYWLDAFTKLDGWNNV